MGRSRSFRAALWAASFIAFAGAASAGEKYWVYVGTYTSRTASKGIYRCAFDAQSGSLSAPQLAAEVNNPSFLAVHPTVKFLYSVGEIGTFRGKNAGAVSAFKLDAASGKLEPLNSSSSMGPGPCHLNVDKTGKCVVVANYSGGSTAVLPIGPDGKLGDSTSFIKHVGSSVNQSRQKEPHAHSVNIDATNRFAVVADLGADRLFVYKLDPETAKIEANAPPSIAMTPGAGPRHFAFHPTGKFAYAINELGNTVSAMSFDTAKGSLEMIEANYSTLPEGFNGTSYTAEVAVHPSGKFLYGSNRGHNSIAAFSIDESTGKLTFLETKQDGIKTPRNFNVDPTGRFLLAASQDGDDIRVFAIDQTTGRLTFTGTKVDVPKPVCVKFVKQG